MTPTSHRPRGALALLGLLALVLGACAPPRSGGAAPRASSGGSSGSSARLYLEAYEEAFVDARADRSAPTPFGERLHGALARRGLTLRGLFTEMADDPSLAQRIEARYARPLREAPDRRSRAASGEPAAALSVPPDAVSR